MFSVAPALQPGGLSFLPDKEDLSGLEMVQRLAKDGCRFLQHHSKGPERTAEVRIATISICWHSIKYFPTFYLITVKKTSL